MKEHPILFSAPMVRAILDGRKTQTRRVVKPQPDEDGLSQVKEMVGNNGDWFDTNDNRYVCKYGHPGDRLWVRETWSVNFYGGGSVDGGVHQHYGVEYKADFGVKNIHLDHYDENLGKLFDTQRGEWRPSIFMPRWASRITLEVTGVRVERLQEITEEDARSEGVEEARKCETHEFLNGVPLKKIGNHRAEVSGYGLSFMRLWDSINGKKFPWESNPWVWVIGFKKLA